MVASRRRIEAVPLGAGLRLGTIGRIGLWLRLAICALLIGLVLVGGTLPRGPRIRQAVAPYAFQLLDWEVGRIAERAGRIGAGLLGDHQGLEPGDRQAVIAYFAARPPDREALRTDAEAAIERGLTALLAREDLTVWMPLALDGSIVFPPVSFSFVSTPQVLIVSPRDRIAVDQSELLRPDVTPRQAEDLEAQIDSLGYASLVVPIGGLATYPTMVVETGRPLDTVVAVAHEWIHGYFFFQPLGKRYWTSPAARTINETAADMASRELGERLARELDLPLPGPRPQDPARAEAARAAMSAFRDLMRTTRITVDELLARGRIEEAERYMRDRRLELVAAGYDIRKLNQAYFAFYGSYGEAAAGANPIPDRLRRLRQASPTVGDFLRQVAQLTSAQDLARAVGDA